jgi:predicted MFS family arabinose efflux permease
MGNFAATILTPAFKRRWLREEQLFVVALLVAGVATLSVAWGFSRESLVLVAAVVGLAANVGRQAFDSVLQRDAPDAARGRYFAWFETRFQLAWVVGALIPVVLQLGTRIGLTVLGVFFAVACAACAAGVSIEGSVARRVHTVVNRNRQGQAPS